MADSCVRAFENAGNVPVRRACQGVGQNTTGHPRGAPTRGGAGLLDWLWGRDASEERLPRRYLWSQARTALLKLSQLGFPELGVEVRVALSCLAVLETMRLESLAFGNDPVAEGSP